MQNYLLFHDPFITTLLLIEATNSTVISLTCFQTIPLQLALIILPMHLNVF